MDLSNISITLLLASLMVASTPILLAAIGELVVERSGVLNLGVEGMMITGAVVGFIAGYHAASPLAGFVAAAAGGAALALLFGVLTQVLLSNQVATGLALTIFGAGLASLLGSASVLRSCRVSTSRSCPTCRSSDPSCFATTSSSISLSRSPSGSGGCCATAARA